MGSHLLIQKHASPADTLLKISNMHQEHCCPQELVLNLTAQGDNKIEVVQDAEVVDLNEAAEQNGQNQGMGQTEANNQVKRLCRQRVSEVIMLKVPSQSGRS